MDSNIKVLVLLINKLIDSKNCLTIDDVGQIIETGDVVNTICEKFGVNYKEKILFTKPTSLFDKQFLFLWQEYGSDNNSLDLTNGLCLLLSYCLDLKLE